MNTTTDTTLTGAMPSDLNDDQPQQASLVFKLIFWGGLVGLILSVIGGAAYNGMYPPQPKLPIIGTVPHFDLLERSGQRVSRADLQGKIWIADFIFTNCAGPCPLMSKQMANLQEKLAHLGMYEDKVQLVSFSLDPIRDTPEKLRWYGSLYRAHDTRWYFLTTDGDESIMQNLVSKGFLQPFHAGDENDPIIHSDRFVLVDAIGNIRGYYDVLSDDKARKQLLKDVKQLVGR